MSSIKRFEQPTLSEKKEIEKSEKQLPLVRGNYVEAIYYNRNQRRINWSIVPNQLISSGVCCKDLHNEWSDVINSEMINSIVCNEWISNNKLSDITKNPMGIAPLEIGNRYVFLMSITHDYHYT